MLDGFKAADISCITTFGACFSKSTLLFFWVAFKFVSTYSNPGRDTFHGRYQAHLIHPLAGPGDVCDIAEVILAQRTDDSHTKDLQFIVEKYHDVAFLYTYLQRFLAISSEVIDRADLIRRAWKTFVLTMCRSSSRPSTPDYIWYSIAQTLIEAGADVHLAYMWNSWDTAYTMVLTTAATPLEADHYVWSWLDILTDCGVLISRYIEREKSTVFSGLCFHPRQANRRFTMIPYRGSVSVPSWQYINDPADPAFALLKTFPALRTDFERMIHPPDEECPSQAWYEWSFPFCFDRYVFMSK